MDHRPIGVFDSGMGGLTVLKALQSSLPQANFIYLGDTARLPYGIKSPLTVRRYAKQASQHLVKSNVQALVVACNTASAHALEELQSVYDPLPVFGVVVPGAQQACQASESGRIAVVATESTIAGGAYQRAILKHRSDAKVFARACPLLVPLAEAGWLSGDICSSILHEYLDGLLANDVDTLLLGCTHYPALAEAIVEVVGNQIKVVDSAATTAHAVAKSLTVGGQGSCTILATDSVARFQQVGEHFLGKAVGPVTLVDL